MFFVSPMQNFTCKIAEVWSVQTQALVVFDGCWKYEFERFKQIKAIKKWVDWDWDSCPLWQLAHRSWRKTARPIRSLTAANWFGGDPIIRLSHRNPIKKRSEKFLFDSWWYHDVEIESSRSTEWFKKVAACFCPRDTASLHFPPNDPHECWMMFDGLVFLNLYVYLSCL